MFWQRCMNIRCRALGCASTLHRKQLSWQKIGEYTPQKLRNSHCCVPFTATFSKRRKIGSLWSERCDAVGGFQGKLPFSCWAKIVPLRLHFVFFLWQNLCLLHAFSCRSRAQPYCVVFDAFSLEPLQMWMCVLCIFHINLPQEFSCFPQELLCDLWISFKVSTQQ